MPAVSKAVLAKPDRLLTLKHVIGSPANEEKGLGAIQPLIAVSKATWWRGVKSGVFPQPVKVLGVRGTFWRASDIFHWLAKAEKQSPSETQANSEKAKRNANARWNHQVDGKN